MLRLAELSASDRKKLVCKLCKKDLCYDLTWEGRSGEVCTDILSYAELALWLCAFKEDNKEEENLVDVASRWG